MIDFLKDYFKSNNLLLKDITNKTKELLVDSNSYILKEATININSIYVYLKSQNVKSVIYPIDYLEINNRKYFLFKKHYDYNYPNSKKITEMQDILKEIHYKTRIIKKIKKSDIKYLYRIEYKLNYKFSLLEAFIRSIEMKEIKEDFDWIILSKYHYFLDCKQELEKLSVEIYNSIENKKSIEFSIIHGKPSIDHLVDSKLISFENAKLGFFVSDISKFYIENDHINIDWFILIDNWLEKEEKLYRYYFKFLVLYIYILNLNINYLNNYSCLNNYIRISDKIRIFLNNFKNL